MAKRQAGSLIILTVCASCTGANPDYDPAYGLKRIFVTQAAVLGSAPSDSSPAGQYLCDEAVAATKLGGTWRIFMSSQSIWAVDALNQLADVGPWYDLTGTLVFADKAAMRVGPQVPVQVTETGSVLTAGTPVWTGTRPNGTRGANLCIEPSVVRVWWTQRSDIQGDIGLIGRMDFGWMSAGAQPCSLPAHVICVEQ